LLKLKKIENFKIRKLNPRVSGHWIKKFRCTIHFQIVVHQNDKQAMISVDIFEVLLGVAFETDVVIEGFAKKKLEPLEYSALFSGKDCSI
jgi:hypothetical protein